MKKTNKKKPYIIAAGCGLLAFLLSLILRGSPFQYDYFDDEINPDSGTEVDSSGNVKLYDAMYFKVSEYFGSFDIPSDPVLISNYNRLIIDLDLVRANFGEAVKIVEGYNPIKDKYAQCIAVALQPLGGKTAWQLYDFMQKQIKANHINAGTLYGSKGLVFYVQTGTYSDLGFI